MKTNSGMTQSNQTRANDTILSTTPGQAQYPQATQVSWNYKNFINWLISLKRINIIQCHTWQMLDNKSARFARHQPFLATAEGLPYSQNLSEKWTFNIFGFV